jgi:hypothetical protein
MARSVEHFTDDSPSALSVVYFLDHSLINSFTLSAKTWWKFEGRSFRLGHHQELLNNRFNELNCASASFDMVVIVMSIFFNAVQRIFKLILAVGHEARVFRLPSGVGRPFIIQNTVAQLVAPTAGLLALTLW